MKRRRFLALALASPLAGLVGCGMSIADGTLTPEERSLSDNYAPPETWTGKVIKSARRASWDDDLIIRFEDGSTALLHAGKYVLHINDD